MRFRPGKVGTRTTEFVSSIGQDVRFTLRSIRREPSLFMVLVLTLTLGIGLNLTIMTAVDAIMLRPPPLRNAGRLQEIWVRDPDGRLGRMSGSQAWEKLRAQRGVWEDIGAYAPGGVEYAGVDDASIINATTVSPGFFKLIGSSPSQGRDFLPDDFLPGAPPIVIVSHRFWELHLGRRPDAIGQPVTLNGIAHTIIGVMGPEFHFPRYDEHGWLPLRGQSSNWELLVLALIRGDRQNADRVAEGLSRSFAAEDSVWARARIVFRPFGAQRTNRDVMLGLQVLAGAVMCVLLIACANAASLLLVRGSTHAREFALRLALGASRARVFRQLLTESLFLSVFAGTLALIFSLGGVATLARAIPPALIRESFHDVAIDGRMVFYCLIVVLATGLLFGVLPALHASRVDREVYRAVGLGSRSGGAPSRLRAIIVGEVAFSTALLLGAGLFVHSFRTLSEVKLGIDADRLTVLGLQLSPARYANGTRIRGFYQRLEERLRALPGVVGVSRTTGVAPSAGRTLGSFIEKEGEGKPRAAAPQVLPFQGVDTGYFHVVGTPVLAGRSFTAAEMRDSSNVIVVDPDFAAWLWPGENPLGKRLRIWRDEPWLTVVGVVGDTKLMGADDRRGRFELYYPVKATDPKADYAIRTTPDPTALLNPIRRLVRELDPLQPISELETGSNRFHESIDQPRFLSRLISALGVVALLLALVGLYGLLSYTVTRRTHEFSVRMAIGATGPRIASLVTRQATVLIGCGILVGLGLGWGAVRLVQSLLFGVEALDPLVFVIIPCILLSAAAAAAYFPARRATRVDPMTALRGE